VTNVLRGTTTIQTVSFVLVIVLVQMGCLALILELATVKKILLVKSVMNVLRTDSTTLSVSRVIVIQMVSLKTSSQWAGVHPYQRENCATARTESREEPVICASHSSGI